MDQEIALAAMGMDVALRLRGARADELAAEVRTAWDRCLRADPEGEPVATLEVWLDDDAAVIAEARRDGAVAATSMTAVMDELSSRVTQAGLEQLVGKAWLLHACALSHPETGATVVLVAASGTGKTTAATTLGRRFGYLTDETAVVMRDGSVVPFPKPLSLLVDGKRPKKQVSPTELGLGATPDSGRLVAVALLQRDPEAQDVRVEEVPTVEALAFLAEQTSSLHLLDDPLSTVAELLRERGGARRLVYAECRDLESVVAGWMEEPR